MSSENPVPSSDGAGTSSRTLPLRVAASTNGDSFQAGSSSVVNGHGSETRKLDETRQWAKLLVDHGDVIIEYTYSGSSTSNCCQDATYRWQVASRDLVENSPYFRALLDPNKFSEGRRFMRQRALWSQGQTSVKGQGEQDLSAPNGDSLQCVLPTIRLPDDQFLSRLGADAIELFLRSLSFNSLNDDSKQQFDDELRLHPTSLIARLVETGDTFNSPHAVREALQRSKYAYGKGKTSLSKFDTPMLKMTEDRIRQSIFVARFLDDEHVFQVMTHTLTIVGSRHWVNGIENHVPNTSRWAYLPDGLEDELYYRRQCVLNTIADLQAYFLRAYGALEATDEAQTSNATLSGTTATIQPRQIQCRCGFGNSSACDAFHLGQMIRFFALRTKTIFLGSTLLDPDFSLEPERQDQPGHDRPMSAIPAGPPSDITVIISSLKQCPDYQLDANHTGCGVRRRFVPPLDCIERFVRDDRGLLGIDLRSWDENKWPLASGSWANRSLRRASVIDIRFSKINAVYTTPSSGVLRPRSQEENARLLFTAKKRCWEA